MYTDVKGVHCNKKKAGVIAAHFSTLYLTHQTFQFPQEEATPLRHPIHDEKWIRWRAPGKKDKHKQTKKIFLRAGKGQKILIAS